MMLSAISEHTSSVDESDRPDIFANVFINIVEGRDLHKTFGHGVALLLTGYVWLVNYFLTQQ